MTLQTLKEKAIKLRFEEHLTGEPVYIKWVKLKDIKDFEAELLSYCEKCDVKTWRAWTILTCKNFCPHKKTPKEILEE